MATIPLVEQEVLANPYLKVDGTPKINDRLAPNRTYANIRPLRDSRAFTRDSQHHFSPEFCLNRNTNPPPPKPLRIVSCNVHNWRTVCPVPGPPNDGVTTALALDALALAPGAPDDGEIGWQRRRIVEKLLTYNADIYLLQEMVPEFRNAFNANPAPTEEIHKTFNTQIEQFTEAGYVYHFISDTHYNRTLGYLLQEHPYIMLCNGIFSKVEPQLFRSYALSNNRICQVMVIDSLGTRTCIYNIHIEYDNVVRERPAPAGAAARRAKVVQFEQLAQIVRSYDRGIEIPVVAPAIAPQYYHVIMGDYNNNDADQALYNPLLEPNQVAGEAPIVFIPCYSIMLDTAGPANRPPKISGKNQNAIIDHVFVGTQPINKYTLPNFYQIIGDPISDHFPTLYDLTFNLKNTDPHLYGGKKITKKIKKNKNKNKSKKFR